jgi:hypothetical protein
MRLPVRKIYRGFPELDRFSDAECERFVDLMRVRRRVGPVACGIGIAGFFLGLYVSVNVYPLVFDHLAEWWASPAGIGVLVGPLALGLFSGMISRDLLLRRGLRVRIGSTRCLNCRHSLLGLPLLPAVQPSVRCPECGAVMVLEPLGLIAADLMPRQRSAEPTGE